MTEEKQYVLLARAQIGGAICEPGHVFTLAPGVRGPYKAVQVTPDLHASSLDAHLPYPFIGKSAGDWVDVPLFREVGAPATETIPVLVPPAPAAVPVPDADILDLPHAPASVPSPATWEDLVAHAGGPIEPPAPLPPVPPISFPVKIVPGAEAFHSPHPLPLPPPPAPPPPHAPLAHWVPTVEKPDTGA